jgi:hypothetical protein
MRGYNGGKELGWIDGVLFGEDVTGLLLGVCGNNNRVICFGVAVRGENVRAGRVGKELVGRLTKCQCLPQVALERSSQ